MKKKGLIYWFFIICYAVQFQFSGDWMLLGKDTIYFALMPLVGVIILPNMESVAPLRKSNITTPIRGNSAK